MIIYNWIFSNILTLFLKLKLISFRLDKNKCLSFVPLLWLPHQIVIEKKARAKFGQKLRID